MSLNKEYLGNITALNVWNPEKPLIDKKFKRLFDLLASSLTIIILFPLFVLISIAIKFSSKGPILFNQMRCGHKGTIFKIYKFRTMYVDKSRINNNIVQAKKNDNRITSIGRFLRKYSLDELPQLINVFKGEMSLVGPRPHAIEHNEYYRKLITGYMQRHSKIPGMTGLAQINGARGETNEIELMKKRIKYDLEYNNNWSLLKDLQILLKTIFVLFKGDAY